MGTGGQMGTCVCMHDRLLPWCLLTSEMGGGEGGGHNSIILIKDTYADTTSN
jgi:hypothetical protein